MLDGTLLNEYRKYRRADRNPAKALADARNAIATGRTTYCRYDSVIPSYAAIGAPFRHAGDICRWIENPAVHGFRFVGTADKIAPRSIKHTGWYCSDNNVSGETARGVVFQMPARDGKPRFVAGMVSDDESALIAMYDATDDDTTAAIWADHLAERYADNAREHERVSSARARFNELAATIAEERRVCLALIAELKPRMRSFGPATCKALREAVANLRESIGAMRAERADIAHAFASHPAWES
ncbi:hypothetical protein [Bradyrhizobium sp. SZCCHNR1075]|uniref:hypothetical protein n=1 Tax=Bradyrhizobium sp. SZCCHNR1075 TaxID=3057362 RepID=UPI0028E72062|nr:hypothetical protein [Bradyrhizobium sp. SZCCHNR1075]